MIDLRSDFCAPPTEAMWEAMRTADWGDATVAELERGGAALLGKEAALFCTTCTQANLLALLALSEPGELVAVDPLAHVLVNEGDWLTRITQLVPVPPDVPAPLTILENTHTRRGGIYLSPGETRELASTAERSHLDAARLPNAAAAQGVTLAALAEPVDTVALSLNKGLCAPYGALLAGTFETIERAQVHSRRLGAASVHKAGIFAAAALLALELVDRVADDNRRARDLAAALGLPEPATNIVLTELPASALPELAASGVLALAPDGKRVRLVTHAGISDEDVANAAARVAG